MYLTMPIADKVTSSCDRKQIANELNWFNLDINKKENNN